MGNMRPLLRLPLWAMASTSLPVFCSVAAIHFHRSTGLSLPSGGSVVNGSTRLACAPLLAEDDVAMQVVAAGIRGPLVPDERGEATGIVVRLRRLDDLLPGVAIGSRARKREALRQLAPAEARDDVYRRLGALAAADLVIPPTALRCGQQIRVAAHQLREESDAVRVIGHDEKVERAGKLDRLTGVGSDLLASGEAVRVLGRQAGAERASVHGERRVQVRVAEQGQRREIAPRVGRIAGFRRKDLLEHRLVRGAHIAWLSGERGQREASGKHRQKG